MSELREHCYDWGRQKRSSENGWPRTSALARLMDEGEGASIREHRTDYAPRISISSREFIVIDRAWRGTMTQYQAYVFWLQFAVVNTVDAKSGCLGISRSSFHHLVRGCMDKIPAL